MHTVHVMQDRVHLWWYMQRLTLGIMLVSAESPICLGAYSLLMLAKDDEQHGPAIQHALQMITNALISLKPLLSNSHRDS